MQLQNVPQNQSTANAENDNIFVEIRIRDSLVVIF